MVRRWRLACPGQDVGLHSQELWEVTPFLLQSQAEGRDPIRASESAPLPLGTVVGMGCGGERADYGLCWSMCLARHWGILLTIFPLGHLLVWASWQCT